MYPVVLHLGHSDISILSFMQFISAVSGAIFIVSLRGKLMGFLDALRFCGLIYFSAFFFAIIGSRIANMHSTQSFFQSLMFISPKGMASQSAILGCLLTIFLFAKVKRIRFLSLADLSFMIAPLVYAIARFGCYLQGCCKGTETHHFWGVVFPGEDVFRHPVQLYDSFLNLVLFLFLLEMRERENYAGHLFFLFLLGNSFIRFFTEYFRWGVSAQVMRGVITQAQMASLGIIVMSLYFMRKLSVKQKTHAESIVQA